MVPQRLAVGDTDANRGLPRAGIIQRVAQRLALEVPDAPTARSIHRPSHTGALRAHASLLSRQ
jgi:hypothetical protein